MTIECTSFVYMFERLLWFSESWAVGIPKNICCKIRELQTQRTDSTCSFNINSCEISAVCLVKALGAAEVRWAVGSPRGPRWGQSGVRTVRPAERRDLCQESSDGSGLRPPDRQEASVARVFATKHTIQLFPVVFVTDPITAIIPSLSLSPQRWALTAVRLPPQKVALVLHPRGSVASPGFTEPLWVVARRRTTRTLLRLPDQIVF